MREADAASNSPACRPVRTLGVALLSAVALAACAGPRMGPGGPSGGPSGGPGGDRPAPPALFVSPFGEMFTARPGEAWPVADWFLGADTDLDGAVVFEEFAADGRRWFDHLDADHDGRLGQAELWAYEAQLAERGGARGGPGGSDAENGGGERGGGRRGQQSRPSGATLGMAEPQSRGGSGGGGGPQRGGGSQRGGGQQGTRGYGMVAEAGFFNLPQPVKAADVNVDQRVTAEEWAVATQRWFLALDTDRDGRLTLETLPKTPLQQRAEARR